MKLTKSDKELLKTLGYNDKDMIRIEEAMNNTEYVLKNRNVTRRKVLNVLSREEYLRGISKSAFHRTAKILIGNNEYVFFNSFRIFNNENVIDKINNIILEKELEIEHLEKEIDELKREKEKYENENR